jgi:hypothetical protein
MTNRELNRDIKRLYVRIERIRNDSNPNLMNDWIEYTKEMNLVKMEFQRVFYADNSMQSLTKQSILILLSLNNSYRFVPLHRMYPHNFKI